MSNEEKTNDYENFEKGMIYMKILKKEGVVEKRGEEETKSMPHAPVVITCTKYCLKMALTCTIYENNFKSEVMKSNNQKQKKDKIQHA